MSKYISIKDLEGSEIKYDIKGRYLEYKSKGKRKIEEQIIKEILKKGVIEYYDKESDSWKEGEIEDIKSIVSVMKEDLKEELKKESKKEIKKEIKKESKKESKKEKSKTLDLEAGEESGHYRDMIECKYESLPKTFDFKWEDIVWERDSEVDYRNYSILVILGEKRWTIYDWENPEKMYKSKKWYISGEGSESELLEIKRLIKKALDGKGKLKMEKHPKEPATIKIEDICESSSMKESAEVNEEINEENVEESQEELEIDLDEIEDLDEYVEELE